MLNSQVKLPLAAVIAALAALAGGGSGFFIKDSSAVDTHEKIDDYRFSEMKSQLELMDKRLERIEVKIDRLAFENP